MRAQPDAASAMAGETLPVVRAEKGVWEPTKYEKNGKMKRSQHDFRADESRGSARRSNPGEGYGQPLRAHDVGSRLEPECDRSHQLALGAARQFGHPLVPVVLQPKLGDDALAVAFELRLRHPLQAAEDLQVPLERDTAREEPTKLRAVTSPARHT